LLTYLNNKQSRSFYKYRIASKGFLSGIYLKELNHLFLGKSHQKGNNTNKYSTDFSNPELVYQGQGIIGEYAENIRFIKGKNSYRLSIGNFLEFDIINIKKNKFIYLSGHKSNRTNNLLIESLLGPVTIFSLALDSIFCMHTSSVNYNKRAILFIGKSCTGKSTLASFLDKNSDGMFNRVSDDITPVASINNNYYVLPHFPQLKLKPQEQYSIEKPSKIKISAIYLLDKNKRRKSVTIGDLNQRQKVLSLISNTVSSRLFDKEINSDHLRFCSALSASINIKKLSFPDNIKFLKVISCKIIEDIKATDKM